MDPKSYAEWCELSGLYLGNVSHLDRYRTYRKHLSPEGLNTVIAADFLSDISEDLDVAGWRSYNVYEMGAQQKERVELTADALTAIGAVKIAEAVRTAKSQSPFDMLSEIDVSDPTAVMQAFQGMKLGDMMGQLREGMARMMPEMAAEIGFTPPANPPAESQEPSPFESRKEIEQLLAAYAKTHESVLSADFAKHGDPRTVPGFTRKKRLQELESLERKQTSHEIQRNDIRKLEDLKSQIEAFTKKPGKRSPNSLRRKFQKLIKENRKLPADFLLPKMTAAVADAEAFMQKHPTVFEQHATHDEQLRSRLEAIGPYEIDTGKREMQLRWDQPHGLAAGWGEFTLRLTIPASEKKRDGALRALLDAVARIRKQFAEVSSEWRTQVVEHFRNYEVQMMDWELEDYELDDDEQATEESILEKAGTGQIALQAFDAKGEDIAAQTYFDVDWDQEHGLEIEWEVPADDSRATVGFESGNVALADCGPQLAAADIAAFENHFGVKLPETYREFLLQYNGGQPQPRHIAHRFHGDEMPFDVDRFYSLLNSYGNPSEGSLEAMTTAARAKALPETLLPIAAVTLAGSLSVPQSWQLFLVLKGKKAGRVLLISVDSAMFGFSGLQGNADPALLAPLMAHVIEASPTVAKDINDLFGKFQLPPKIEVPEWLKQIRNDDISGFTSWLDSGGKLSEKHTGYGDSYPRSVTDILTQESSIELLQELLGRKAIKPSAIRDSWRRFLPHDMARFRALMPILPKELWPAVLMSTLVWSETELLDELAAAGIDLDSPIDNEGRTPLHYAVEAGQKEAVKWLMEQGADPHKPDKYARNAFVWAERGPGFDCLSVLEGEGENAGPTGDASPDDPGLLALNEAAAELPNGLSLNVVIQIQSPAVTRVEKAYDDDCHYRLTIDLSRQQITLNDMRSARQDYLSTAPASGLLFAPILQWPELTPLWETLEVQEFDWPTAMKKRKYKPKQRDDLQDAARSALEQAFQPNEAAARGIRLQIP